MLLLIAFQLIITLALSLRAINSFNTSTSNTNIKNKNNRYAIVTLISGNEPYISGALALGQSLIDSNTKLDMVVMCTPDVNQENRELLSKVWKIRNVEPLLCNHKHNLDDKQYDLKDDKYLKGINKWSVTCTKFRVWQMTDYKRVIFMDSDTLVLGNIDKVLFSYSNASFVAAPESFPPDTFNSGFMIITPNDNDFQILTIENDKNGSPEGGDQGILNRVYSNWFQGNDMNIGKLPYIYNVGAAYYTKYKTMQAMANLPAPLVIHFVSSGKPWLVLKYEYYQGNLKELISPKVFQDLGNQAEAHFLWRDKFFKQTKQKPSSNQLLLAAASGKPVPNKLSVQSSNKEKTIKGSKSNKNKITKGKVNDQKHATSSLLKKRKAQKKVKDNNNNHNNKKTNKIVIPKGKNRISKREIRTDL